MTIQCPNCNTFLDLDPELAGKIVECANCGQEMQVPLPQGILVEPETAAGLSPELRIVCGCGLGCLIFVLLIILIVLISMISMVNKVKEFSPVQEKETTGEVFYHEYNRLHQRIG